MNKPEKKALVPALRFPEFQNAVPWGNKAFEEVFKRLTTKNSENNQNALTISAQQGLIAQLEYFNKKVAAKDLSGYYLLHKGDFAYNKSYSQGYPMGAIKPLKCYDKGVVSTLYICFRARKGFNESFFEYYFETGLLNSEIGKIAQEGGRAHGLLNVSVKEFFKDVRLLTPQSEEQQKIADCLASLDDLITAETQKLAAIKNHKKGLMQQLFPSEGETVPRLRFPEFRDAGEWEEKPLKRIFSIFQGFAFSSNDTTNEGTRWLKIADVGIQYMNPNTPSYLPANYKDEYEKFLVTAGDYVIALTRPILGKELKMAKVDSIYDNALLNQRVGKLVTDENKDFVYCLLQTSRLISDIEKNIAGNDPPNLSSQQIGDILVRVPLGDEQQKIADCLSSVDELIAAKGENIEALKLHKKGLMQQLFPVMEEVAA